VILAVGQEKMNLVNESAIKAVGAFGGGIAASGSVCGTLLGGVAMISSLYSRGNLGEKEDPRVWVLSSKFMKQFKELTKPYGGMNCSDIAGVDWKNREAVKKFTPTRKAAEKDV